jgi:hypothetical protein
MHYVLVKLYWVQIRTFMASSRGLLGPQAAAQDLVILWRADLVHAKRGVHACQGDVDLEYASVMTCFAESL